MTEQLILPSLLYRKQNTYLQPCPTLLLPLPSYLSGSFLSSLISFMHTNSTQVTEIVMIPQDKTSQSFKENIYLVVYSATILMPNIRSLWLSNCTILFWGFQHDAFSTPWNSAYGYSFPPISPKAIHSTIYIGPLKQPDPPLSPPGHPSPLSPRPHPRI